MKTITTIVLCTISLSLWAQEGTSKKDHWEKMKDFMPVMTKSAGVSFQDFNGLNSRIAGFPQYKAVKGHTWTIGAGSMHNYKNFISQVNLTAGSSLTGDADERSSTVRVLGAAFDLGYDVIPADAVLLYPLAGIGVETYHAIFYRDVNAVDFDDVLSSPAMQNNIRSTKFTNTFGTYRLGLGVALKSPKGHGTIGLEGRYIGSFKDRNWKSAEYQDLSGAPNDGLHRFAVSLILSGGHMMMRK